MLCVSAHLQYLNNACDSSPWSEVACSVIRTFILAEIFWGGLLVCTCIKVTNFVRVKNGRGWGMDQNTSLLISIIDNVLLLSIQINCKFHLSIFCVHILNSHREVLLLIHITQIRIVILNMPSF